jgi:hypothetical protein
VFAFGAAAVASSIVDAVERGRRMKRRGRSRRRRRRLYRIEEVFPPSRILFIFLGCLFFLSSTLPFCPEAGNYKL